MKPSPSRRAAAAFWLLAYAAVWSAAPFADARLEAAERAAVVHVEAESEGACNPGHDHSTCLLCQFMAGRDLAAGDARLPAVAFARAHLVPAGDHLPTGLPHYSSLLPRGPPA